MSTASNSRCGACCRCSDHTSPHLTGLQFHAASRRTSPHLAAQSPLLVATDVRALTPIMREAMLNTELLAATAARAGTTEHLALFKLALSDKTGELCIQPAYAHTPERNWGNGQLVPLERCLRRNNTSPSERVRISTLDDVLERLDLLAAPVGTIKVDVRVLAAPLTTPALRAR